MFLGCSDTYPHENHYPTLYNVFIYSKWFFLKNILVAIIVII